MVPSFPQDLASPLYGIGIVLESSAHLEAEALEEVLKTTCAKALIYAFATWRAKYDFPARKIRIPGARQGGLEDAEAVHDEGALEWAEAASLLGAKMRDLSNKLFTHGIGEDLLWQHCALIVSATTTVFTSPSILADMNHLAPKHSVTRNVIFNHEMRLSDFCDLFCELSERRTTEVTQSPPLRSEVDCFWLVKQAAGLGASDQQIDKIWRSVLVATKSEGVVHLPARPPGIVVFTTQLRRELDLVSPGLADQQLGPDGSANAATENQEPTSRFMPRARSYERRRTLKVLR